MRGTSKFENLLANFPTYKAQISSFVCFSLESQETLTRHNSYYHTHLFSCARVCMSVHSFVLLVLCFLCVGVRGGVEVYQEEIANGKVVLLLLLLLLCTCVSWSECVVCSLSHPLRVPRLHLVYPSHHLITNIFVPLDSWRAWFQICK